MSGYRSLVFTQTFLESLASKDFTVADRRAFLNALALLDRDERHPSLRVQKLKGDLGTWSGSASGGLRMTLDRLPNGRKILIACSKHYDR